VSAQGAAVVMVATRRMLRRVCTVIGVPCIWWFAHGNYRNDNYELAMMVTFLVRIEPCLDYSLLQVSEIRF